MRIVETPVYDFTELSDTAKDKARTWFRETIDHDWWDSVYDDFEQICPILGVTLATTHRPPDGRRHPPEALHLVFRVLVRRATAPVSRAVMPMPRARRVASATMRPRTRSCTGSPTRCRRCRG